MNISSTGSLAADLTYAAGTPAATLPLTQATPPAPAQPGTPGASTSGTNVPGSTAQNDNHNQALDEAIKAANDAAQRTSTSVEFARDSVSGKVVVKIIDGETQKVIRQIPSEEMIQLSQTLGSTNSAMIQLTA